MKKLINKIHHIDCLDFMKELPNECVNLILTDPAYLVTARGNSGTSGGMLQKEINKKGKVFDHNFLHISEWIPEVYRVLKNNSHCYIMCNHVNLHEFLDEAKKAGFHFIKSLIWDKGNKIMGQAYMSQFEYILFFRKGEFKKVNDCGMSDIIYCPNIKTKDNFGANIHDTEKPIALMEILIRQSTSSDDIVFDPFGGSCPVACACFNSKRNFLITEIDSNIYLGATKRFDNHCKQQNLFANPIDKYINPIKEEQISMFDNDDTSNKEVA